MRVSGEFIRYCLVGVINTLAGISTAYIALNIFSQPYLIASACAYIVGISVSFSLNKIFTFKYCEDVNCWILFFKFLITMLPSYSFSYFLGWAVSKGLIFVPIINKIVLKITHVFSVSETRILDNAAIVISMIIYLVLGFLVNKYFVFKKNKPQN